MKKLSIFLAIVLIVSILAYTGFKTITTMAINEDLIEIKLGDYILLGKYNDEPILWRCADIDENGILMLSDKILCIKPYDIVGSNHATGSHSRALFTERSNLGSNYWGDSNMRSWLNSTASDGEVEWLCCNPPASEFNAYDKEKGFLADGNFTETERLVIKKTKQPSILDIADAELAVSGSADVWEEFSPQYWTQDKGLNEDFDQGLLMEYVTDRIFLLDVKQLWRIQQNKDILGAYHTAVPTQKAVDNYQPNEYEYEESFPSSEKNYEYFLRTPIGFMTGSAIKGPYYGVKVARAHSAQTREDWLFVYGYAEDDGGVRPAFYLDKDTTVSISGTGTKDNPYVLDGKKKLHPSVFCNGSELEFDVPPIIENGRTLVPFRVIFEALGASVDWEAPTRTVIGTLGGTSIKLTIDQDIALVNGQQIKLDVAPRIIDGRTIVPLRFIAENFDFKVEWDEISKRVDILT